MLVLFDQSTPSPLRFRLEGHTVVEARERGWDRLVNGDLLKVAEEVGFELFITADKNLRYQQNLTERKIAIVVIGNAQWRVLRHYVDRVISAGECGHTRQLCRSGHSLRVNFIDDGAAAFRIVTRT